MNIAIVNRVFWKDGAIPLTLRNLVDNLSKKGIETTMFASDVSENNTTPKVNFVKVFRGKIDFFDISGLIFAFFLLFKLISIHRKKKIDLIEIHDSTAFYGAWLFSKIFKIPNIIFMHACIYEKGKEKTYRKTTRLIYKINTKFYLRYADRITCVSERLINWAKYLGADKNKLKLIDEPIDTKIFNNSSPKKKQKRMILFVGRLSPEKGLRYLLLAMPKIIEYFPDAKLVIIGEGREKDNLLRLAETLNIENCVSFEGEIPNCELPKLYSRATVVVIPSLSEGGGPKVLLESLGCGAPVIGTGTGRMNEIIVDGYNGFLIEPKNRCQIEESIKKLFSDEKFLIDFSNNARHAVEIFSWERGILKFTEMYKELVQSGRKQ